MSQDTPRANAAAGYVDADDNQFRESEDFREFVSYDFACGLERELAEATAWKTEIQGAIQRSGMGILRTSQGPSGTMIGYRPEIENFHFQKETELIAENASLRADLNRLRKALEDERDHLVSYNSGRTHWSDCEKEHPSCAALIRINEALADQ